MLKDQASLGQILELSIGDLAFGGEGVARVGDFVVFVSFVIPGELVRAEIVEVKKRFARARLLEVLKPSLDRATPVCPYFGECGGCQYQHIRYAAQLGFKHKQIEDVLERIGQVAKGLVAPVVPCPSPYGYRNRIMIRSQWDKFKQGLNIGYIRYDNRLVVDITHCPIAEPILNEEIAKVRAHPPPKGGLKVVLRVHPEGWEVPPDSFFQNNFHLLNALVQGVRERIVLSGGRHLVDVYCGVGFFGIELADRVETFAGIEFDQRAIQAARRNALARGRTNGEFIAGRAEEQLPELLKRFPPEQTAVILDPPRTGCPREMLELLRSARVRQIIYVSCHPATLARDLAILQANSIYQVLKVTPFDMFPQTQHVECVADLRSTSSLA